MIPSEINQLDSPARLAEIERILAENAALKSQVAEYESDLKKMISCVIGILKNLGIWPMPENVLKQLIKNVPKLMTTAMINPGQLEKDFKVVVDNFPVIVKYSQQYEADGTTAK